MKVSEIMTTRVESISSDATIKDAADKMRVLDIGFLPILENNTVVGAITDRDITVRQTAFGRNPRRVKCREIITPSVFYRFDDEDVEDIGQHMQEKDVKRLLILNRDYELVGVVSLGDISKAQGEQRLAGETLRGISEAA